MAIDERIVATPSREMFSVPKVLVSRRTISPKCRADEKSLGRAFDLGRNPTIQHGLGPQALTRCQNPGVASLLQPGFGKVGAAYIDAAADERKQGQ